MSLPHALAGAAALSASALGVGGFVVGLQQDHGIPVSHGEAYIKAAQEAPCPLDYRVLAAVGAIESGHGTSKSRDDSGLVVSYAGAQGDMQFMPATWAAHAVDGDGDGRADIDSTADSAASAAAYLCSLNVDENLDEALGNYNGGGNWRQYAESRNYVADVKARMAALPPLGSTAKVDTGQAERITQAALAWVGKEFNPGTREQCMFFVRAVLQEAGVVLAPDVTTKTLDGSWTGAGIANSIGADQGQVIERLEDVRAGDIVTFENTYGAWERGAITHVGIAVSDTDMVDRSTASAPVKRRPLTTFQHFGGAVRLKGSKSSVKGSQSEMDGRPKAGEVVDALLGKGLDGGAATCVEMRKSDKLAPLCDMARETGEWVME